MDTISKLLDAASVKRLALEHGFDKVGIASAEDFDFPAWAHSAIVLGYATLDEAYDYEMYIQYQGQRKWHKPIYTLLEALSARLTHPLRQEGCRAEHLTFEDSISIIDLKKAAVLAGLGTLGLNNVVVNKEYGPRIRFGAVFTDLELEPDRPLDDYYCSSCTICWGACPTRALGPNSFDTAFGLPFAKLRTSLNRRFGSQPRNSFSLQLYHRHHRKEMGHPKMPHCFKFPRSATIQVAWLRNLPDRQGRARQRCRCPIPSRRTPTQAAVGPSQP